MATVSGSTPSDPVLAKSQIGSSESLEATTATQSEPGKPKEKKKLFGLLKRKDGSKSTEGVSDGALSPDQKAVSPPPTASASATTPARNIPRSVSPSGAQMMTPPSHPTSNPFPGSPHNAASPSRYVRSSSPRLHSPASSSIFERNVQEAPLPDDLQQEIPRHIQTEDYIPPILEASSMAITDEKLNPDEVEIVMHSAHQPAATTIASPEASLGQGLGSGALSPMSLGSAAVEPPILSPPSMGESLSTTTSMTGNTATEEPASHYGALDSADVRRLSFISFADVVQGEHALEGSSAAMPKDLHMSMISTTSNRSPSPVRSPASSHGPNGNELGMSPPTSGAPSMKGVEIGKTGLPPATIGSPQSLAAGTQSPSLQTGAHGELTVETMRQALRKTGSGDLSHARSPVSPS